MSYYAPAESGAKVNMIKEKFERSAAAARKEEKICRADSEDPKDFLRRSMSASPVKSKRNPKEKVSRQLSNPGKNIKRTPAFRGDKAGRTKNLQSPTREKFLSIVGQNVKIFEEQPEYGKLGNVKKKSDSDDCGGSENGKWKIAGPENSGNGENRVKTTIISRQKNISPIFRRESLEEEPPEGKITEAAGKKNLQEDFERFFHNGVEYTRVKKKKLENDNFPGENLENPGKFVTLANRRKNFQRETEKIDFSIDETDAGSEKSEKFREKEKKFEENFFSLKLTDTLKAALEAPLPPGPPPKKPPRTFAHSPTSGRWIPPGKIDPATGSQSSDEDFREKWRSAWSIERFSEIEGEKKLPEMASKTPEIGSKQPENREKSEIFPTPESKKEPRDSKKMLEKLETVLIQHQKALGPKIIRPRTDRSTNFSGKIGKTEKSADFPEFGKKTPINVSRLSRTLEDPKKSQQTSRTPVEESENGKNSRRKNSTFDCLPALNCAGGVRFPANSQIYEKFDETSRSMFFIDSTNFSSEFSGKISDIGNDNHADKRLSSDLTTFTDGKKISSLENFQPNERVYAEPFAHDQSSGIDITALGIQPKSHLDHYYFFSRTKNDETGFPASTDSSNRRSNREDSLTRGNATSDKPELHYMCTSIEPLVYEEEDNNNVSTQRCTETGNTKFPNTSEATTTRSSSLSSKKFILDLEFSKEPRNQPENLERLKAEEILNEAFGRFGMAETPSDSTGSSDTDSMASSSASISDELSTFNEKLRIFKHREISMIKPTRTEVHRSLTEKRKNYVRRVSSKYSETRDVGSSPGGVSSCCENFEKRDKLFEVCLLVELNLSTHQPYIKDKYPEQAKTPAWIENFCFPDSGNWPESSADQNQFYSLALMDERGNRRYGYCRRVRPEGGPILPLAYCLISKCRAAGFYRKVLLELESRHGLPDRKRRIFVENLHNCALPGPGQALRLTPEKTEFPAICEKKNSPENHTISEEISIIRSGDPRLEERDMSQLFDALTGKLLIFLFGSLLLERKVVFLCEKIGKLSSCVEAMQSLLYPFVWPHTFVPVLPDIPGLTEILQAPLPYVIGILKNADSTMNDVANIQDGIVVDLDASKIVHAMGDESSILPSRLQKATKSALQLISSNSKPADGIRNFLVSEAFIRIFVETCSHFESHIVTQQDGKIIFQKESFVKGAPTRAEQYFLEWFVETTMFNVFIKDCIERMKSPENRDRDDNNNSDKNKLFFQRVAEYRRGMEKNDQSKKNLTKKKTLGDRLKDLTNFHS